jgi:branched-chain amino acid transport system ATP-binding protein
MPILEVHNLVRRFGGLTAVNDLSMQVQQGEIHGLIGPNGAGKTTTFNVITGFYAPSSGRVLYNGRDISGMRTSAIAELGLVRTFQSTTLFQEMRVIDNVLVGSHLHARSGLLAALTRSDGARQKQALEESERLLDFFGIAERADHLTSSLPHGLQRALGLATALAARPGMLLLDEPFTGMNNEETRQIMEHCRKIRDSGVTILLVEHDMQAVMGLCDRITVMNFGSLLAEGTPEHVRNHTEVIEAYLCTAVDVA